MPLHQSMLYLHLECNSGPPAVGREAGIVKGVEQVSKAELFTLEKAK